VLSSEDIARLVAISVATSIAVFFVKSIYDFLESATSPRPLQPLFVEKKVKTAKEFASEVENWSGYVVVKVDPEKCGYCKVYAGMVKVLADDDVLVLDVSEVPEEELEALVEKYGFESAPALLRAYRGEVRVLHVSKGDAEMDLRELREVFRS
jgi:thiol-disulfide isomerase/thioredoxin